MIMCHFFLFITIVSCYSSIALAQSAEGIVLGTVRPAQDVVTVGLPVTATLMLQNLTDKTIELNLGEDRKQAIRMDIAQPSGKITSATPKPREGIARFGKIAIAPGKTYSQNLILNDWGDFDRPGIYVIVVHLDNPVKLADGSTSEVPALHFQRKIVLSEPGKVEEFCAKELKNALTAQDYAQAIDAAHALSRVQDPKAIPYLAKAFQTSFPVYNVLASGFARIGTDDAAKALLSVLKESAPSKIHDSKGALERLELKIKDPQLRTEIHKMIEAYPEHVEN